MTKNAKIHGYDFEGASALLPLLRSIAREIQERETSARVLERRISMLQEAPSYWAEPLAEANAQLALHRREIRMALRELENLGCRIVDEETLTIRIPHSSDDSGGFDWRLGDASVGRPARPAA